MNNRIAPEEGYITLNEAKAIIESKGLSISDKVLYQALADGTLKGERISQGRRLLWRLHVEDVNAYASSDEARRKIRYNTVRDDSVDVEVTALLHKINASPVVSECYEILSLLLSDCNFKSFDQIREHTGISEGFCNDALGFLKHLKCGDKTLIVQIRSLGVCNGGGELKHVNIMSYAINNLTDRHKNLLKKHVRGSMGET